MMGCGASSNPQVSPMNNERNFDRQKQQPQQQEGISTVPNSTAKSTTDPRKDFIDRHHPHPHPHHPAHEVPSSRTHNNRFTLSQLFPCVSNHSPSLNHHNHQAISSPGSVAVQTEDDQIGFKERHSQTDSTIMSDEELEALVEEIGKYLAQNIDNPSSPLPPPSSPLNGGDDPETRNNQDHDSDEELFRSQKTWRNIVKNHMNQSDNRRKVNVAVQATRKKRAISTQTKFGSIDIRFGSKNDTILNNNNNNNDNELMSCELCSVIVNSNTNDPNLVRLLSSLDEDDMDCEPPMKINAMVNSLRKTFHQYDGLGTLGGDDGKIDSGNGNENSLVHQDKENVDTGQLEQPTATNKQQKFQNCLFEILQDIRSKKTLDTLLPMAASNPLIQKRDVSLQTTNDILTDEAPEFAARPPLCNKTEMIPSVLMFRDIDQKMSKIQDVQTPQDLAKIICKHTRNDLFKIRALFCWITKNIRYNFDAIEKDYTSTEILAKREGVSKDYCRLFSDVCRMMGIRVKQIDGFVRDYNYRPGQHFQSGNDPLVSWNATFVLGSWRFVDLTLASGFTDASGKFQARTNEHYFLTDPNEMIWTHFPCSSMEQNYERWQLLDKPLTLDEFNDLPKISEYFFKYNLSIRSRIKNPLEFRISTEVKIGSHEAMRYKYKFYKTDESENSALNYYVFCQLKEDRLVGSFMVQPPLEGRFLLKIYAKPEREMQGSEQDLMASLNPIVTMLLECTKARKYIEPFPLNELPWGLTQKFYDYKLKLCNQKGPIIVTWGGRRRLVMEANETMLLSYSLYDSDSMEMDTRNIITRDDTGFKTTFTINPPRVGTFKFIMFGMPKPKQKGKWRLPMLATMMIDCKLIKPPQHDEDMVAVVHTSDDKNDKKSKGKK